MSQIQGAIPCPRSRRCLGCFVRWCRKTGCSQVAAASCEFNYTTREIWISELRHDPDPTCYDLCQEHAERFVAPIGWTLHDQRATPDPADQVAF
jgi:uncharacterized protein DUF3499